MTFRTALTRRPTANVTAGPFNSMDRLFEDFLRPLGFFEWERENLRDRAWTPAVDVSETDKAYLLHVELPGLTKENINLTFENGVLNLSGERKFEERQELGSFRRIERSYGTFSRSFALPTEVDSDKAEAKFIDGVLSIMIPKTDKAQPKKITVS